MGNEVGVVSGDQTVTAVDAAPRQLALLPRQEEGFFLSKWLEKGERQLDRGTPQTWEN